jgi:2-polyprenyl-3-methyl-5-hydroxy-6-metoxy-1,4-benzoquinol methylase
MRFTDKQFFDWEIDHGLYPGGSNRGFYEVHEKLADFILSTHVGNVDTHLDLGGGNSPLTKILQNNGVNAHLIELNQYSCDLQKKYGTENVFNIDFCANGLTNKYDVITSIEVFEHTEDRKLIPFISKLANHCEYFIFSSTPHKDTPEFDEQWGHVNIKTEKQWIRLFEVSGFHLLPVQSEYLQKNCIPTTWTLMFKSKRYA